MHLWNRRDFVKTSAMGLAMTAGRLGWPVPASAKVSLVTVGSGGREEAIRRAVDLIGAPSLGGKYVALKPNFNSAHAYPGGTHSETIDVMVRMIKEFGADRVVVPDRSGMGNTREVYQEKGVFEQAEKLGFEALPLLDLPAEGWTAVEHPDLHWSQGYYLGSVFNEVDSIIQTCCLKTHGFGGHFTLSLKNTIGMIAADVPGIDHQFMRELHSSPIQRTLIAEANLCYQPELIVMDAIECFTDRGPHEGTRARPNVILASTDRVAIDAVGVAILREKGTTEEVSQGRIFDLEQLKRAVELGIGVDRPENIEFITADGTSDAYSRILRGILLAD